MLTNVKIIHAANRRKCWGAGIGTPVGLMETPRGRGMKIAEDPRGWGRTCDKQVGSRYLCVKREAVCLLNANVGAAFASQLHWVA
jgi:hypothetical protein